MHLVADLLAFPMIWAPCVVVLAFRMGALCPPPPTTCVAFCLLCTHAWPTNHTRQAPTNSGLFLEHVATRGDPILSVL